MTKVQAYELLELIEQEAAVGPAEARQLGNGEYVIRLRARSYHLWSLFDYYKYLEMREQAAKEKELAAV